jgi:hypothetical protein
MGVWGSIFGWKTLFRWDVLGAIVPGIFLAVGVGMMTVDWFPRNLLIAQVSFTIAIVLFVIKAIGHAIESEGSRVSRILFAFFLPLVSITLWWQAITNIQQHKTSPSSLLPLLGFLENPWVGHISWMCLGMVVLILLKWVALALASIGKRAKHEQVSAKGFLDFKFQAETAIAGLSPALESITAISVQVGNAIDKQTRETKAAALMSTRNQIRVTKVGAMRLDKYSRRLNRKCFRLEQIGSSLQEGLLGWYTWAFKQEASRIALSQATPSLRTLCESMAKAIQSTEIFIATLEASKGVSRDMNDALERHIQVLGRIRNANSNIASACLSALQIADANALPEQPSLA